MEAILAHVWCSVTRYRKLVDEKEVIVSIIIGEYTFKYLVSFVL